MFKTANQCRVQLSVKIVLEQFGLSTIYFNDVIIRHSVLKRFKGLIYIT